MYKEYMLTNKSTFTNKSLKHRGINKIIKSQFQNDLEKI